MAQVQFPMEISQEAIQLCYAWGRVRDQNALILCDPGSTHSLISVELAHKLGIQTQEIGSELEAYRAFKEQKVPITPLIGKLRLHIQAYVDQEEFFVSPLMHQDVILGAPWFHGMAAQLKYPERKISFHHRGRPLCISTVDKGNTIPIVSHVSLQKSIKSSTFMYMISVKDSHSRHELSSQESNDNECVNEEAKQRSFLQAYDDCFSDSIPNELPPIRGDDDHRIELVPGSTPPNRPLYRVSYAQQEEIHSQVKELMEKGMIRSSSSPFCSPVLLVQERWFISHVRGLSCTKQVHN